jgi:hypothetical protein
MVVIGRVLGKRWLKQLTRREIKRCQNNGLLYKVLPQEVIHFNYSVPPIETLKGEGFTSYDQMRFDRPRLYIKYWKIWNGYIEERRKFIRKYDGFKDKKKWMKEHFFSPLPDWDQLKRRYHCRGLENLIVPPPTVEQVQDKEFDAWEYCYNWVSENCPEKAFKPHFPPMFLDHPDPYDMRSRPYKNTPLQEKKVDLQAPERTKHYNRGPTEWLEQIEKDQWMQIYF